MLQTRVFFDLSALNRSFLVESVKETALLHHGYSRIEGNYSSSKDVAVATSSTSYLQTLTKDETLAFLTSLQKVKDHLNEELQWMNQQVQQKSIQLQGIETLLGEARAIGLAVESPAAQESEKQQSPTEPQSIDTVALKALLNNSQNLLSVSDVDEDTDDADEAMSSPAPTADSPKKQTKNAKQPSKAASKRSTSAKKPKSSSKPKAKGNGSTKGVDLRELLQPTFQDMTFGDAVSEILEQANQPLHLDDLIDKMYKELSDQDYQRAKGSLANVLSVGTGKGRWKNVSKGMYASNAIAAS